MEENNKKITLQVQLLTPEKVAEILDVNPATVRTWLRDGTLKGVKIGGRMWRVTEKDLKNFIERGKE